MIKRLFNSRRRCRVPMVMQMEATECGAASLTMILAHYGRWLPLETVRYDCGVSRDGSSLANIYKAATRYGLQPKAFKIEPENLCDIHLPLICHWEFNHFIVVTGYSRSHVYVNDPGRGRVRLSREEFDRGMTGVVMTMQPGPEFKRGGHRASVLSFARRRLEGAREAMLFTFITALLMSIIGVMMPVLTQIFADDILTGRNPDWFRPFMAVFCLLTALQVAIQIFVGIYRRAFSMKLSVVGNSSFLWHVLHLPMHFFAQRSAGDIVMRQRSAATVAQSLVNMFAPAVTNVLLLVLYLYFMLRYSLTLTAVVIVITLFNILLANIVADKQVDLSRTVERNDSLLTSVTMASMGCIETVKAAGAEEAFFKRWTQYFASTYNAKVRYNRIMAYMHTLPHLLILAGNTTVLAIGTYYILQGEMTVGMLMAFQAFMTSFMTPVEQIVGTMSGVISMRSSMERMEDVFRMKQDPVFTPSTQQSPHTTAPEATVAPTDTGKLSGHLELRNVTFGYSRLAKPLIQDFSLTLKPGHSVAFVGGSGCGKSTLAKIIAGLYQPWSGEVLFDGRQMQDIPRSEFVSSVAVIDQDIVMFDGTLAENIKMWDGTLEDFAMILAAHQACIHDDIASRPEAYDAHVSEGGSNFSGGQRQRIEIATALVREPSILIMDEATSALDTLTEAKIMETIRLMGITLVIVAHRLSTIRDCDEIIVLDHGVISERGTHDQLMQNEGYYYQLMQSGEG